MRVALVLGFLLHAPALAGNGFWQHVGTGPISEGGAICTRLCFHPAGDPIVAYHDMASGGKASVQRFRAGAWEYLGAPASASVGTAWYNAIACDAAGSVFLGSRDYMVGGKFVVRVLHPGSGNWETVGTGGASPDEAHHTWLQLDPSGIPVIAFQDRGTSPIDMASVMRFDPASGAWNFVGPRGFSNDTSSYNSVKVAADGTLYAAHSDVGLSNGAEVGLLSVRRYDPVANSWQTLGNPLFSEVSALNTVLELDRNGTPWVALHRYHQSIRVYRFDGADWQAVGGSASGTERPTLESEGYRQWTSLCFDSQNRPHVAYQLFDYGNKGKVRRFNGTDWVALTDVPFSVGGADYLVLGISPQDVPYVAYRDMGASTRLVVQRFIEDPVIYGPLASNSLGCVADVWTSGGLSNSTANPCWFGANQLFNQKKAMPLWSRTAGSMPFGGSTLLLGPPIRRTVLLSTGGGRHGPDCSGTLLHDWNAYFLTSPSGLNPGEFLFAQYWIRDPGLQGSTYLTRAVRYLVQP
jgi:hypothetical protein